MFSIIYLALVLFLKFKFMFWILGPLLIIDIVIFVIYGDVL